jgi:Cdc6-like AAA superfamily ATPase
MKIKSNGIKQTESFDFCESDLKELIEIGFNHNVFLGGQPGTGQKVEFHFYFSEFGQSSATAVITTVMPKEDKRG